MAKTTSYNPYQEEIIGLERQRDTMRKIREEASAPMQGQMVSGWYVGPSWTQGLANMLRGYIGKRGEEKAEAGIAERQAAQKTAYMGDMSKLAEIVRTGGKVDPGAFSTQEGQQAAMAQLVEANKPYNLGAGEKRFVGGREIAAGDPKSAWAFSPPAFAGDPPKWVNKDTQQVRFQDPTGAIQTTSFALPPAQPPAGLAAAVRGPVAAPEPVVTTPLPAQAPITGQPLAAAPMPTVTPTVTPPASQPITPPVAPPVTPQAAAQPVIASQPVLPVRPAEPAKAPDLVPVYDPRTRTTTYVTKAEAAGRIAPPPASVQVNAGEAGGPPVKLKPGERWNKELDRVEFIPGSTAHTAANEAFTKDYKRTKATIDSASNAIDDLNKILDPNRKGAFESNFGGYNAYATREWGGPARSMAHDIDSLKAKLMGMGKALISESGSPGTMTQSEWAIMERQIASISPDLGEREALESLNDLYGKFGRMIKSAQDTYDTQYKGSQFYKPVTRSAPDKPKQPAPKSGARDAADAILNRGK